jgi:hypothetical protein
MARSVGALAWLPACFLAWLSRGVQKFLPLFATVPAKVKKGTALGRN